MMKAMLFGHRTCVVLSIHAQYIIATLVEAGVLEAQRVGKLRSRFKTCCALDQS